MVKTVTVLAGFYLFHVNKIIDMKNNHICSLTFLGILILVISYKDDDENSLIVNCGTVSISQTKEMPGIVGYNVIQTTDCNYLITGISDNGSTLLTKIDSLGNE